jgi:hypothetical protein
VSAPTRGPLVEADVRQWADATLLGTYDRLTLANGFGQHTRNLSVIRAEILQRMGAGK